MRRPSLLIDTGPAAGSFHGRSNRGAWFVATGLNGISAFVVASMPGIGPVVALPWIAAMLAASSRRLHDTGRSGWWQAIPWAVATLIAIAASTRYGFSVLPEIAPLLALPFVPGCLWLGFVPGAREPNVFGESSS